MRRALIDQITDHVIPEKTPSIMQFICDVAGAALRNKMAMPTIVLRSCEIDTLLDELNGYGGPVEYLEKDGDAYNLRVIGCRIVERSYV